MNFRVNAHLADERIVLTGCPRTSLSPLAQIILIWRRDLRPMIRIVIIGFVRWNDEHSDFRYRQLKVALSLGFGVLFGSMSRGREPVAAGGTGNRPRHVRGGVDDADGTSARARSRQR